MLELMERGTWLDEEIVADVDSIAEGLLGELGVTVEEGASVESVFIVLVAAIDVDVDIIDNAEVAKFIELDVEDENDESLFVDSVSDVEYGDDDLDEGLSDDLSDDLSPVLAAIVVEEVRRLSNYNAFVLFWRLDHPVRENGARVHLLLGVANSPAESFGQYIVCASAASSTSEMSFSASFRIPFAMRRNGWFMS